MRRPVAELCLLALLGSLPVMADELPPLQPPPASLAEPDLRVQLNARQRTVISSELAGKITEVKVKEGDSFRKGERLVGFDCAIHRARLGHSAAAQEAASRKLGVARKLDQLQSISVSDLSQAQAELSMARAQNGVNQVMVQHCSIDAPFSGRVAERKVQPGEYVAEGKELLALYDDSAFEVELIVPSRWMVWLKPGFAFSVHLDETGSDYPAKVDRLGSVIDPLSQSIKVFGRIDAQAGQLLPGMSGNARITPPASADS
ncbi:efflux RND transporter periplasmic adaptor subunit [Pantoea sp. Tr-811]|uniref:efflux RND transporter periplasmic adaptor subunit n=1 Tax=Pantoea sp. Tr-811 TaxID=2608361 RepID=UPI0014221B72|nr:efflux RND transporter periplasmic adaptor subunit [Pantoea sp. Tr-811]NIF29777.1 efflux RND transporter periplasmic adaptor subunit [Pantoea sp. Tr-811]